MVIDQAMEGGHALASADGEVLYEWEPLALTEMVDRLEGEAYDHAAREMGLTDDNPMPDELLDDLVAVDFKQRGAVLTDEEREFAAQVARRGRAEIRRLRARVEELETVKDHD